jgi:hypothetical protein
MDSMDSMESQDLLTPVSKNFLLSTAKWAKIVSIINFVFGGLMVILAFSLGAIMSRIPAGLGGNPLFSAGGVGIFGTILYLIFAALIIVPAYFLFTFASKTKQAILSDDDANLEIGLHNIKRYFQFNAILLLIVVSFYALIILLMLVGGAAALSQ